MVHTKSDTGEVSNIELTKPEIKQPEYKVSQPESPLVVIAPNPKPPSPRRKLIVMIELPIALISIEDTTEETETTHSPFTDTETFDPRVPFSPFRTNPVFCNFEFFRS